MGNEPSAVTILKEDELQQKIADSPSLLREAGVLEPVAVATEMPVPGVGTADVVLVDAEGTITIVECKLEANPEIRRWVIGQLFSYAAGLWKLDYENFMARYNNCGTGLTGPFAEVAGWDEATFRSAVSENLDAGTFQLIVAVDQATLQLVRTVVFLNSRTVPEVRVLAVGLHQVADDEVTMLPPVVYGDEYVERVPPRIPRPRPSRKLLVPHIRRIGEEKLDDAGAKTHPARRWVVERTIAWLLRCRAILIRYDKKSANYEGLVQLACALL